MSLRVAYIVNQYPKISHSFIRREMQALEAMGVDVIRLSVRGRDTKQVESADVEEQRRTFYLLAGGLPGLALASMLTLLSVPGRFCQAFWLALRLSVGSSRNVLFHLTYLTEACVAARHLRGKGVNHLHAHFGTNSAEVALLVSVLTRLPYSFTAHGPDEFDRPLAFGLPEKIRRAAFVIAVSSFGRSQLYRWVSYREWEKIHVVHCGLGEDFLAAPAAPCPDAPRLVCVGRICEQKGQLLLVDAMKILAARGVRCELVLAGDGEMREAVDARITEAGLGRDVLVTGWIAAARVREELLAARALVLPSFAEGLPVVIMEAMALGRPVISTSIAGIPELVESGRTGWLVHAGDVEALAAAMEQCLKAPRALLDAYGDAGRERVRARHDAAVEARKLASLIARFAGIQAPKSDSSHIAAGGRRA